MKKVVFASLLAVAGVMSPAANAFAQTAVSLGQTAPAGQIQMSADEYAAYNAASTATTPAPAIHRCRRFRCFKSGLEMSISTRC